jgi:hypothetical protein
MFNDNQKTFCDIQASSLMKKKEDCCDFYDSFFVTSRREIQKIDETEEWERNQPFCFSCDDVSHETKR